MVELDAGLAWGRVGQGVVDWAGSVGWHHEVDIVKTRWVGDVAALCGGRLVGRRKKIGQHVKVPCNCTHVGCYAIDGVGC